MKTIKKHNIKYGFFLLCIIAVLVGVCLYFSSQRQRKGKDEGMAYSIKWQGLVCQGIYKGEMKKGSPSGQGEFWGNVIIENEEKERIEYSGNWKEGMMQGKGKLYDYGKEKIYEGNFKKNKLNGEVKEVSLKEDSDKYEIISYKNDEPYGVCWEYEGENITGYDYYYKTMRVEQILRGAKEYSYAELIYNNDKKDNCLKIELQCTVNQMSYNNDTKKFEVKVEDRDKNDYVLEYDISYKKVAENYMPVLVMGDDIVVYGYFLGFKKFKNKKLCPYIDAVIAKKTEKQVVDVANMEMGYADMLDYPYLYYNRDITISGRYKGMYSIGKKWKYVYFEAEEETGEKYMYICKVKENIESILSSDKIEIEGKLKLVKNYRNELKEYVFFPVVEVENVSMSR